MIRHTERRGRRSMFTMIELMIVVIIVGILAAAAVPLYQGTVRRAYESEISSTLGAIRSIQRIYMVEHGVYKAANTEAEFRELGITPDDFRDMQYVIAPGDEDNFWQYLTVTVSGDNDDEFIATWTPRDAYGDNTDMTKFFERATINQAGQIEYTYR